MTKIKIVDDLIKELQKYPAGTPIVAGNGGNGYFNLYVSTVKNQISPECIIRYCEAWGVTPDTVTISAKY